MEVLCLVNRRHKKNAEKSTSQWNIIVYCKAVRMSDPKTTGYTGDSPEPTPQRHNVRDILSRLVIFKQLENPREHHFWEKAAITFVVAVAGAAAPIGSSIVLRE